MEEYNLANEAMFYGFAAMLGGIYLGGKDTQANWVSSQFPEYIVHQTTSGLLKAYPAAVEQMKMGQLVDDDTVYDSIDNFLCTLGTPKGLLGNGWVRKPRQAPEVYDRLTKVGYRTLRFVEFQIGQDKDHVLEERRLERWNEYHRPDDQYDVAWKRIEEYRKMSLQINTACRDAGFDIVPIDASLTKEEVKRLFVQAIMMPVA